MDRKFLAVAAVIVLFCSHCSSQEQVKTQSKKEPQVTGEAPGENWREQVPPAGGALQSYYNVHSPEDIWIRLYLSRQSTLLTSSEFTGQFLEKIRKNAGVLEEKRERVLRGEHYNWECATIHMQEGVLFRFYAACDQLDCLYVLAKADSANTLALSTKEIQLFVQSLGIE